MRPLAFVRNCTRPGTVAKIVWSVPMPTPVPGCHFGAALTRDDVARDHGLITELLERRGAWTRNRDRCAKNRRPSCEPWVCSFICCPAPDPPGDASNWTDRPWGRATDQALIAVIFTLVCSRR